MRCWGIFLLLLFAAAGLSAARGEVRVSFAPEHPRAGDYVDVTVEAGPEAAEGVRYSLSADGETVFKGKKTVNCFTASFRPRKEASYVLEVTVVRSRKKTETVSVAIPVSGTAPVQKGKDVIYSQMDGWWRGKVYSKEHKRTLESSGCALFALSHALQRIGFDSGGALPDSLAKTYSSYYIEGVGTGNEALITQAAGDFGFQTVHRLVKDGDEIASFFGRGDCFSFGIVKGHVVLADGLDEEKQMVHVTDSAPGVTFERLRNTPVYIREEDGGYRQITSPAEIPGIRWFFETSQYGGAGYWLEMEECAKRGLRLIRRPWLTLSAGGASVSAEWIGTEYSLVSENGMKRTVRTRELAWLCQGSRKPLLAVVTRPDGAPFTHSDGSAFRNFLPVAWGKVLPVLQVQEDRIYVFYRGTFGYLPRADAELAGIPEREYPSAVIIRDGSVSGAQTVRGRQKADDRSPSACEWPTGTPVIILEKDGAFCLVEGEGCRGWVSEAYLMTESGE